MMEKVLVTGGAGFIGSHLTDALLKEGYKVVVFDSLETQVHGEKQHVPEYLSSEVELIKGDMRSREDLEKAMKGVDVLFHLAAAVGVGQSMYQIQKYVEVNALGTAILLDILANKNHSISKLLVASSMSIYGEGKYKCKECGIVFPKLRDEQQLKKGKWEILCPNCLEEAVPLPTDEDKPLFPTSVYAVSKRDQEEACLCVGKAYKIPTVALRYFNVYGPRQALSNPYTGVAAIFSSRILNNKPPSIFEDGLQSRDFIHVSDIVEATILAMKSDKANYQVFNVGTGRRLTVFDIADFLIDKLGSELEPGIVSKFREGDIRHCFADISKIQERLGFKPKVSFENGIVDLVEWASEQKPADLFERSSRELEERGLTK